MFVHFILKLLYAIRWAKKLLEQRKMCWKNNLQGLNPKMTRNYQLGLVWHSWYHKNSDLPSFCEMWLRIGQDLELYLLSHIRYLTFEETKASEKWDYYVKWLLNLRFVLCVSTPASVKGFTELATIIQSTADRHGISPEVNLKREVKSTEHRIWMSLHRIIRNQEP